MSYVAKMHLGNCLGLKGFAGRRRGMRMGDTGWWSRPWIYVSVTEPFMSRQLPFSSGGRYLFATETAVQILAVLVHLLPLWDSPPPPLVSHPVPLYTSFVKHTKKDRHTIKGHFSIDWSCIGILTQGKQ